MGAAGNDEKVLLYQKPNIVLIFTYAVHFGVPIKNPSFEP